MKKLGISYAIIWLILFAAGTAFPTPVNYYIWNDFGGIWADAEKTSTAGDDLMCWASAASNILEWTGWGKVAGLTNTDQMFAYIQNHWTDSGGFMEYGWEWWFSGNYNGPTQTGWSQPVVQGGGFYPSKNMYDYFYEVWDPQQTLSAIDQYLRSGFGTTLAIYSSNSGHALTCWGFQYDLANPGYYNGVYVSDSDDGADTLRYYAVKNISGIWYLQNFYGTNNKWYIGGVQALAVPEPITIVLLALGISGITRFKRK